MGLGSSYWSEVIEVLREIIPIYDKVNSIISFDSDKYSFFSQEKKVMNIKYNSKRCFFIF